MRHGLKRNIINIGNRGLIFVPHSLSRLHRVLGMLHNGIRASYNTWTSWVYNTWDLIGIELEWSLKIYVQKIIYRLHVKYLMKGLNENC